MVINDTEIRKLSDLLTGEGIGHEFREVGYAMGYNYQICIPSISDWNQNRGISVSINCLTVGHNHGLVELWDKHSDPVGPLTAEQALAIIKKEGVA